MNSHWDWGPSLFGSLLKKFLQRARCCKLYGTWYVSLPSNQTESKHFVCSLSGSQLMWQRYLYLPGPTGKIQYQNFNATAWVLPSLWFSWFCMFFVSKGNPFWLLFYIQSTLVISNSKGLYETVRDIRTSTYQICGLRKTINRTTTFNRLNM